MFKLTTDQKKKLASKVYWWCGPEYFFLVHNKPDAFNGTTIESHWKAVRALFSELCTELKNSNDKKFKMAADEVGEENFFLYVDFSKTQYAKKAGELRKEFSKILELIEWEAQLPKLEKEFQNFTKKAA